MTLLLEGMGTLAYGSGELYMMAIHIMGCARICTVINYNTYYKLSKHALDRVTTGDFGAGACISKQKI
jgi:hypothetical protein